MAAPEKTLLLKDRREKKVKKVNNNFDPKYKYTLPCAGSWGSNMLGPKSINKLNRQTDSYKIWSPNDLLDVSKLSVLKERIERRCKTATQ